jgi:multidrug efflux pump subunit AcrB
MWIVILALRRPYTIAVAVILLFIAGYFSLQGMLVDIFPVIDIPVVGVLWNYPGLSAVDMERRVVFLSERAFSTTVNGITNIESTSIPGTGILKIYFEQGTDIGEAIAEIGASSAAVLRSMPPGITAPLITKFNAASVPVAQLTMYSDTLPEFQIFDYGLNFLRIALFTIPGLSTPAPYGGMTREINIDLNPEILQAKGLSPQSVVDALSNSNLILPAGTSRIGTNEYNILLNSSPATVADFNGIPIEVVNGAPVTLGSVAKISDSFADQTNIVRVNGKRASFLSILKKAGASTLTVVNAVKKILPSLQALAPKGLNLRIDFDQSVFVRAAVDGVLREALVSGTLISLMVLLFLGSWRSVIIVATSIPAAICASIIGLSFTGNSINIMTLGGLSLAIGMLVDDATVEIENIHRNRAMNKPLTHAILDGARQVALPAIMATLSICVIFLPIDLLTGPARYLFIPLALSVVFSMLASYVLSRSLVPLLSQQLLAKEREVGLEKGESTGRGGFARFERLFDKLRRFYEGLLGLCLENRGFILLIALAFVLVSFALPFFVGMDFFPSVDTGLMKLHFRAAPGTRIEQTEREVAEAEKVIRGIIPASELQTINSNVGVPIYYNLGFVPSNNSAAMDAEILIELNPSHKPSRVYQDEIRKQMAVDFPGAEAYFQPADIVSQLLNFGLSAPIDVQFQYPDVMESYRLARILMGKMKEIAGIQDVALKQVFNYPGLFVDVDRLKAAEVGLTEKDVVNSILISLSTNVLVAPSYFLNPENNVNYNVVVKTPLNQLTSVSDILWTPVTPTSNILVSPLGGIQASDTVGPGAPAQRLGNISKVTPISMLNSVDHSSVQRVVDVTATVEGRDLGSVVSELKKATTSLGQLKPGMKIRIRGQPEVMREAFVKLGLGLILAMVLVYLLMVILFQSWLDPFIVMVAVPGALCGILWMLFLTGTTINVESFMGAIMAVGIAASNSILLVSFANDIRVEKDVSPLEAARAAGTTRFRPVLMTALAMTIGMTPAALALGEGGEQNAPLGRAVVGGLLVATFVTLLIVPVVYSLLRTKLPSKHLLDERMNAELEGRAQ